MFLCPNPNKCKVKKYHLSKKNCMFYSRDILEKRRKIKPPITSIGRTIDAPSFTERTKENLETVQHNGKDIGVIYNDIKGDFVIENMLEHEDQYYIPNNSYPTKKQAEKALKKKHRDEKKKFNFENHIPSPGCAKNEFIKISDDETLYVEEFHHGERKEFDAWLIIKGKPVSYLNIAKEEQEKQAQICNIETRHGEREKGHSKRIKETLSKHLEIGIESGGSYTFLGYDAFGEEKPEKGVSYACANFVHDWTQLIKRNI